MADNRFEQLRYKDKFSLDPEILEDSEEIMKFLESCLEYPIQVDLMEKCITIYKEKRRISQRY